MPCHPDRRPRGHNRRAQQRRFKTNHKEPCSIVSMQRPCPASTPRSGHEWPWSTQQGTQNQFIRWRACCHANTIGLLVLVPSGCCCSPGNPPRRPQKAAPSGSPSLPLAVPTRLTVGNGATPVTPAAAKPVEEKWMAPGCSTRCRLARPSTPSGASLNCPGPS